MKIKHDYVHSNEPKPETMLQALINGALFMACIFLASAYIYILGSL